jgi:hypothetical protein
VYPAMTIVGHRLLTRDVLWYPKMQLLHCSSAFAKAVRFSSSAVISNGRTR